METAIAVIIASIVVLLIVTPLLFLFKRSSDIRMEGDLLVLRYPFTKEEIQLSEELKSWHLQEAHFLRFGKVYSLNMELNNGKWKSVSSRFNADSFKLIFHYFEKSYGQIRKADNK